MRSAKYCSAVPIKTKNMVFNVNYEFEITAIDTDSITLDNQHKVPIEVIRSHFTHNYCRTCHSFQGSSIDDKITIYDWKHNFASRKWIYTAVARATNLENVYLLDYDEYEEDEKDLLSYLQKKVDRYKQQDKKAKRQMDPSNYLTSKWLYGCLGNAVKIVVRA